MVMSKDVLVVDVEAVLVIDGMEAAEIRDRLIQLRDNVECAYLDMMVLLDKVLSARVGSEPLWKDWGYDSFDDYCQRELGFRERKAYYLLNLHRQTSPMGPLPRSGVESMGWTKASLLAPLAKKGLINEQNVDKWVARATEASYDELRVLTKAEKRNAEKKAEKLKDLSQESSDEEEQEVVDAEVFIFRVGLFREQHLNWNEALRRARVITGSDKKPHLVDVIALAFNSEAFDTRETALDEICNRVERAYGVRLIALNNDGKAVHGNDVVGEILGEL